MACSSMSCMYTLYRQVRLFTKHTENLYYCLNYVVFATGIATAWYLYRVGNKSLLKCMDFLEKRATFL